MRYIITESQYRNLKLRRNLDVLPKFISSTYKWLNPKAFNDFEEFLDRVVFSATRDFVAEFNDDIENYERTVAYFQKIVKDIVYNQYYDEILYWYTKERI